MNVLVYNGPGTSGDGNLQMIAALRELLEPNYVVAPITEEQILKEPWERQAALLVIPGGADLPYCRSLNGTGNEKIKKYVRKGGRFLGVCAGAYFGSARCEFELGTDIAVAGPRELSFFPGTARGSCFKRYVYGSSEGAHAAIIQGTAESKLGLARIYVNGGPYFDMETVAVPNKVQVLANYVEDVELDTAGSGLAAIVKCEVGAGKVVLSGPHMEWSASRVKDKRNMDLQEFELVALSDNARTKMLVEVLKQLDLKLAVEDVASSKTAIPQLTPMFAGELSPSLEPCLNTLISAVSPSFEPNTTTIVDSNDTIVFYDPTPLLNPRAKIEDREDPPLEICVSPARPESRLTPHFSMPAYFSALAENEALLADQALGKYRVGRLVIYGEVVKSTSTMLERNPKFLSQLPHGLLTVGTQQVQGRGRGGNVWVNPIGVLAVSGILRVATAALHHPLVFVQYLVSLAVVEAIRDIKGYENLDVRLKWPNDIYIKAPTESGAEWKLAKIGGVIVSVSAIDGDYVVVFGSGTNVANAAPTTSLNVVADAYNKLHGTKIQPLTREQLLAKFAVKLNELWNIFITQGFRPLEPRYYRAWLHSEQVVILEHMGAARVKIKGISPESGMLIAQEVNRQDQPTGGIYELQPDGNSFDMFAGLIRKKC